jgi:hypothetical protein
VFDIGVYLAVIGLAMMVFESFGDDTNVVAPRPIAAPDQERVSA